jgi:hypothetical protein
MSSIVVRCQLRPSTTNALAPHSSCFFSSCAAADVALRINHQQKHTKLLERKTPSIDPSSEKMSSSSKEIDQTEQQTTMILRESKAISPTEKDDVNIDETTTKITATSEDPPSKCRRVWDRAVTFYWDNEFVCLVVLVILLARAYPPLGATYLAPNITSTWIAVIFIFSECR